MVRIRRIGILRTATVLAILYAITALIFFLIFAVLFLATGMPATDFPGGGFGGTAAGGLSVLIGGLVLTAVYGLLGWVFTALFCLLYNVVADVVGGVEFELQSVVPPQRTAPPQPTAPPAAPPPAAG